MHSSYEEFGITLDPRSHTAFTFSWPAPHSEIPMLPLRTARHHVRARSFAAAKATRKLVSSGPAVLPSSDWGNLPQDVLLSVLAQLQGSDVMPAVAACKQWRGPLAKFANQAKISQLPLSTPMMDAARRKLLWLFPSALIAEFSTVISQISFQQLISILSQIIY